ncbi:hypothetical protein C815_00125 [Firmicutes bacterium M10-2]|nr:hypothetical protein C815_00125 [Firmicutes bacterium M10-2]
MKPAQFPGVLLVNLLVCLWIGYLLDDWFNTRPIFLLILVLYALIGSFALLLIKGKKKHG